MRAAVSLCQATAGVAPDAVHRHTTEQWFGRIKSSINAAQRRGATAKPARRCPPTPV